MSLAASSPYYDQLRSLPLTVTAASWEPLQLTTTTSWVRHTWQLQLSGAELHGFGEDVSWKPATVQELASLYPLRLIQHDRDFGSWTDALDEWEAGDEFKALAESRVSEPDYLRWAIESAGVELALRQSRTTLAELFGIEAREPAFGLSMGLGSPPDVSKIEAWREFGDYRFKLDANSDWDDATVARLAELQCVDVVDLKAYYHGTSVDQAVDTALYERVARLLPNAVLEDLLPRVDTMDTARACKQRLAWDAPVHAVEDLREVIPDDVGFAKEGSVPIPRFLNIKPSRFATWKRLLTAYGWAKRHGVTLYGGGQFELGIGRAHIQALAAMFHPDGPNDIAPTVFHSAQPQAGLASERVPLQQFNATSFVARDTPR